MIFGVVLQMPADIHQVDVDTTRRLAQPRGTSQLGPGDNTTARCLQRRKEREFSFAETITGLRFEDCEGGHGR